MGSYCRCSCAPTISVPVSVYVCLGGDDGVTILSLPSISNRCLFLSLFPSHPTLSSPSLLLLPRWCLDNFANQDISSGWVNITFYYLSVGAVTILVSRYSLVSWQGKKTQSGFNFRITSLNVGNKHHYFCYSESHLFIFQDIAHILHTAGYGTKEFSLLRLFFIVIEVLRYCPSVFVCLTVWMGSNQWGLIGVTLFWTEVGGGDIVVRSVARCCIT